MKIRNSECRHEAKGLTLYVEFNHRREEWSVGAVRSEPGTELVVTQQVTYAARLSRVQNELWPTLHLENSKISYNFVQYEQIERYSKLGVCN